MPKQENIPTKIILSTDVRVFSYSLERGTTVEKLNNKTIKITKPDGTPREIECLADNFMKAVDMFNGITS